MITKSVKIATFTAEDLKEISSIDRNASVNITSKSNIVDFKFSFSTGNIDIMILQASIEKLKKFFEDSNVTVVIKGVTVKAYNKCAIITVEFPELYSIQVI